MENFFVMRKNLFTQPDCLTDGEVQVVSKVGGLSYFDLKFFRQKSNQAMKSLTN